MLFITPTRHGHSAKFSEVEPEKNRTLYRAAQHGIHSAGNRRHGKETPAHGATLSASASREASGRARWGQSSDTNELVSPSSCDWHHLKFCRSWKQRPGPEGAEIGRGGGDQEGTPQETEKRGATRKGPDRVMRNHKPSRGLSPQGP